VLPLSIYPNSNKKIHFSVVLHNKLQSEVTI
jgi:hypothetical protein